MPVIGRSSGNVTRVKLCQCDGAVDERRLSVLARKRAQEPGVEEDRERDLQPGVEEHHRRVGAEQPGVLHEAVQRHERELEGQHDAEQEQQVHAHS